MKELFTLLNAAYENKPSANFSAEDVNTAAINALTEKLGLTADSSVRDIRAREAEAFALIEETVDEILPKKLEGLLGEFAEVKSFARDAEIVFNIEKIGKNRAKLTIGKGARGGIYRAAKLDSKYFSLQDQLYTVAVFVTLEDLILGKMSLSELFNNILEGFQEIVYREVFNALAAGNAAIGETNKKSSVALADLSKEIDALLPIVKQYGIPTIFGSYKSVSSLYNPLASTVAGYPNIEDSADVRKYGFVQIYKGVRVVELPNYLVDNTNNSWFYDSDKYVFILPSGAKPVKVGMRGEMLIQKNSQAVGSEKWEANKYMGVGVAMANNYAVIEIVD